MKFHTSLTPEHWFKYSLFQQLANVGTDLDRAIRWKKNGDSQASFAALCRAFELLDLTILDPKNRKGTLRELVRARESLKDHFLCNDREMKSTDEIWSKYFYQFNYAYAISRGK